MKLLKIFLAIGLMLGNIPAQAEESKAITVYRSPTCSCCGKWLEHLKQNGFSIKDVPTEDMKAIKHKYGVSDEMASCHTAIVDGYVVEGHVPADDIKTLLKTKPNVVGIAVPQMPSGTPGMEMGGKKDPYNVMSFDTENHSQVFKSHTEQ
jgi:hypothetical protein